ncbi:MAG: peptidoglycan DD-metalloendopeptidase family protein [Granulosicoccus sp.]|nr:peptidoglycan DD-metalloendopeptidase family protein [Granulosicoccus sp.]
MNTRNAQHRPHCVDLSPGSFNRVGTSTGSATRYNTRATARFPQQSAQRPKRRAAIHKSSGSGIGAVRIHSTHRQDKPGFSHTTKLTAALAMVAGGILWTTASNGTDVIKPAPAIVQASIPAPTFFFDDAADALTTHLSTRSAPSIQDGNMPAESMHSDASPDTAVTEHLQADTMFDPLADLPSTVAEDSAGARTVTLSPLYEHPSLAAARKNASAPEGALKTIVAVAPGNTLSGILNRHGVKIEQMPQLLTDDLIKQYLSNLKIGLQLEIQQLPNGDFHSLAVRVGDDKRITIRRSANNFAVASIDLPVEKERVVTSGTIEQSLYLAAEEANLKQSTIMELADIFQWELDFARDIRKGDQFSLVYDRLYRDGSYIGDGDILAAEFIRGGKNYRAIRFTTDDGVAAYYDPNGQPKRRTFKRHPVDIVRITSKFNPNRLHPVLHQIRAHRGVDYGSPHGSPIYATADGKVTFSGSKNAYGNTVILQHGKKFSTLYAHMSKISGKSVVGKRVKQGDVIGYVGKTGRVTGTHLHYEFRVNNKQIDPLKVELPAAQPIDRKYLPELAAISEEMTAQMRSVLVDIDQQVASVSNTLTIGEPSTNR